MCRNIRTLFNFDPPATEREVREAALQFVRKLSGMNAPSAANQAAFDAAVDAVAQSASRLIATLVTNAVPKDRDVEAAKARATALRRHRDQALIGAFARQPASSAAISATIR